MDKLAAQPDHFIKVGFAFIWLVAVALVVSAIYREESPKRLGGKAIAQLVAKVGAVEYRGADLFVWYESEEKQTYYEGDRLSTGRESSAKIRLFGGKTLELGPNSQIEIHGIENQDGALSFQIDLVRGYLSAQSGEQSGKSKAALKINAGDKAFELNSDSDKLAIEKNGESPVVVFNLVKDGKQIESMSSEERERLQKEKDTLDRKLNPFAYVDKESLLPRLEFPKARTVLWYFSPLSRTDIRVPIVVDFPKTVPSDINWKPLVSLSMGRRNSGHTLKYVPGKRSLSITAKNVDVAAARDSQFGSLSARLRVTPGYTYQIAGKDGESHLASEFRELIVHSFAEIGDEPVSLYLSETLFVPEKEWVLQRRVISRSEARLQIDLYSGATVPKLSHLLSANEEFGLVPADAKSWGKGVFLTRGSTLLARLSGPGATPRTTVAVAKALGATLAYEGDADALLVRDRSLSLSEQLNSGLVRGKAYYVLVGRRVKPVSTGFTNSDPIVARFIEASAPAIFTKKVKIVHTAGGTR